MVQRLRELAAKPENLSSILKNPDGGRKEPSPASYAEDLPLGYTRVFILHIQKYINK